MTANQTPDKLQEAARRAGVRDALGELLSAYDYAADTGRDVRDFAVEIRALKALGVSLTDLRWLTCRGYVVHARETTASGASQRTFRPEGDLSFGRRSGFVLSSQGVARVREVLAASTALIVAESMPNGASQPISKPQLDDAPGPLAPRWDLELHELRLNGLVVKRYRVPSPNQELVLTAFQEEGWPRHIDDPLPPQDGKDSKRRLHDTIKCLNQRQTNRVLRFQGDGRGRGVYWEILPPDDVASDAPTP